MLSVQQQPDPLASVLGDYSDRTVIVSSSNYQLRRQRFVSILNFQRLQERRLRFRAEFIASLKSSEEHYDSEDRNN